MANNAIDDTGKYVASALSANPYFVYSGTFGETVRDAVDYGALLDQAFNMGTGRVTDNIIFDQIAANSSASDDLFNPYKAFAENLGNKQTESILENFINSSFNNPTLQEYIDQLIRQGLSRKDAEETAYYHFLFRSIE